jgi:transposase
VDQRELIRRDYFIEGKSIRRIARERRHDRRTIRTALNDPGPPRYTLHGPRPRPVLGPFLAVIDHWLAEDLGRPAKQRHTAHRIYERLAAEMGFQGGESTIRQYVGERRPRREVMIPLDYDPGEAQADWGEAQVYLGGRLAKVHLFCMRLCVSHRPFLAAFPRQSQEAFLAGHVAAFDELGGVPRRITYDNLALAVKRVLTGPRREEQRDFVAFRSYYLFESNFCRPGEAHEKGLVENLVGYARRNFLVPLPRVASLEELNAFLRERCRESLGRRLQGSQVTVGEAWEEERRHLLPLPARLWPCCVTRPTKVTLSCLVFFDGNRYSVPTAYAGRNVLVRAYVERVEIAAGERIVASHRRSYERGQDVLDPYHYIPALLQKPRAFHQARAMRRYPWPETFRQALSFLEERHPDGRGAKEFLRILALQEQVGERRLGDALELALRYRCVGADAVRHLLHRMETTWQPPLPLDAVPLGLTLTVPARDLSQYNQLLSRT